MQKSKRIKFQERKEIAGNHLEPELREALGDRAYEELKTIYGI